MREKKRIRKKTIQNRDMETGIKEMNNVTRNENQERKVKEQKIGKEINITKEQ